MWCEKCHYGTESYNFKHCGHCGSTNLTSKNPFTEAKKTKTKKKEQVDNTQQPASTHDDVEAIVSGKVKPSVMR